MFPRARAVFLADSDSLVMKHIEDILQYIRQRFPHAERITSYARAKTLLKLGPTRLASIKVAGLTRVHVGLESGDAETLAFLQKGATPEEMIAGGKAAKDAGLELSFYLLIGAGGRQRLRQHAVESARVCNAVNPDFIRLRTLIVQHGSLLEAQRNAGRYTPTSPLEKLREVQMFVKHLTVHDCELASDHLTNYLWWNHQVVYHGIAGNLPEQQREMLAVLSSTLETLSDVEDEVLDATLLYDQGYISSL